MLFQPYLVQVMYMTSGGFRNLERGVQRSEAENFGVATPTSAHTVRTEYLEATLGLVKRLEISKELIRECVTVPWLLLLHATAA